MKCIICNGHHPNTEGLGVCTGGTCRRMRIEELEQQLKEISELMDKHTDTYSNYDMHNLYDGIEQILEVK